MNKLFFLSIIFSLTVFYSQSMEMPTTHTIINYGIHYKENTFNVNIDFFEKKTQQQTRNTPNNHYQNNSKDYPRLMNLTIKVDKESLKAQNKIFQKETTALINRYICGKYKNKELIKSILKSLHNIKQPIEVLKQGEKSQRIDMINKIYNTFLQFSNTSHGQQYNNINQIKKLKKVVKGITEASCNCKGDTIQRNNLIILQKKENQQSSQLASFGNQNNILNNSLNQNNDNIEHIISHIQAQQWDNFIKIVLLQKLSFDKEKFTPIQWNNLQKINTALKNLNAQLPTFTYKKNTNKRYKIKISCELLQGTHKKIQEYKTSEIKTIEIIDEIIKLYKERIQKLDALELNGQKVLKNEIEDWKQKLTINRKMFEVAKEREKIKQKQTSSLEQYQKALEKYIQSLEQSGNKKQANIYKIHLKGIQTIK